MSEICGQDKERIVQQLDSIIQNLETRYENHPKQLWPECPEEEAPPTRTVAHPYLKGVYFKESPTLKQTQVKVTLDGRLGSFNRSRVYTYYDPPLGIPPWFRPRSKSVELRAGRVLQGCDCVKKNGLQDSCQRWDCQRPECMTKPVPECPPSVGVPLDGVRKPNAFM